MDAGLCGYAVCLLWGDAADGGVDALPIVVAVDVSEQVTLRGREITRVALVDEFGFQGADKALHGGMVAAVCRSVHSSGEAVACRILR